MAGMEALGRLGDIVPIAGGQGISMQRHSGITFVCTNSAINAVFTLTLATSFGGSYSQPSGWNPITHYYQNPQQNGTGQWSDKITQAASNAVTQANNNYTTVIEVFGPMIPDTYKYIKCTNSGGAGLVTAWLHDPTTGAAKPANLHIVGV